jgi:hypothetical protein
VASDLYPTYFETVDIKSEVCQFYETLFEINITDDMCQAIIHGETMRLPKN